ncbi:hypothetical protein [Streptomyces sp. DW26H14]|uniref:hypothetical protein n=1 Tax=Streptomyces sp. DW26H14 TaxID=3435395 RepID=UPI00403E346E
MANMNVDSEADVSVQMTMVQYRCMKSDLDNEASTAAEDGRPLTAQFGSATGVAAYRRLVKQDGRSLDSGAYPGDDELVTITLSRQQWSFAVHALDHWALVTEENNGDLELQRCVREIIVTQMGEEPIPWQFD